MRLDDPIIGKQCISRVSYELTDSKKIDSRIVFLKEDINKRNRTVWDIEFWEQGDHWIVLIKYLLYILLGNLFKCHVSWAANMLLHTISLYGNVTTHGILSFRCIDEKNVDEKLRIKITIHASYRRVWQNISTRSLHLS